jgi:hypothetical protein
VRASARAGVRTPCTRLIGDSPIHAQFRPPPPPQEKCAPDLSAHDSLSLSRGILRKGTVTFNTPPKSSTTDERPKRSMSERRPAGPRSVTALFEKSSVLTSALSAAVQNADAQHTPSRLQDMSSSQPAQAPQTAPRPHSARSLAMDAEAGGRKEDDAFDFSNDVTSLTEILQGSGISEKRLAPEAALMRKSSVHEFRQLREKRCSIFKGPIRVVKGARKAPPPSSTHSSSSSSFSKASHAALWREMPSKNAPGEARREGGGVPAISGREGREGGGVAGAAAAESLHEEQSSLCSATAGSTNSGMATPGRPSAGARDAVTPLMCAKSALHVFKMSPAWPRKEP